MDAIHYKIREDHQIVTKAAYVILGINNEGIKEVLGLWVGASESAKYWMGVLNELKSRGVQNVSLFCVDGLAGFREAITAVYPKARIQRCIIHQIRNSTRFVSYKQHQGIHERSEDGISGKYGRTSNRSVRNFQRKMGQILSNGCT